VAVTSYEFESLSEVEAADLLCARFQSLRHAGCDLERALIFASRPQLELEEVARLVRTGSCELAAALLTLN
jgi:hypothetical protein